MAWMGYTMRKGDKPVGAVVLALILSLYEIYSVGGDFAAFIPHASINCTSIALCVIAPKVVAKQNARLLTIRDVATHFLSAWYPGVRSAGLEEARRVGESNLANVQIEVLILDAIATPNPVVTGGMAVSPSFELPMIEEVDLYLTTLQSFIVSPARLAKLAPMNDNTSVIKRALKSATEPVLDPSPRVHHWYAFDAVVQDPHCSPPPRLTGFDAISIAELYYGEMIMTEYSSTSGKIGGLRITTRDGRSFTIAAKPELAEAVRTGVRRAK
jgi:hypothetical protein